MIKKIVIRDVASYDHDGVTFDNLARVNFIYGGNGTGKTTLTRVLDNPSAYPQCGSVSTSVSEVCRLHGCGAKLDKYFHFNHWF